MVAANSPSIEAAALHRVGSADALAFVDELLGAPEEWPSPLIGYRLASDFQADWKEEVGHWLKTAERFGFLDQVMHEIRNQAKRRSKKTVGGAVDPNEPRHLKLNQHLAAARVAHYLTGTEWDFLAYEPERGGAVDVDLALATPDGQRAEFQVKAPDQPGRKVGYRLVDGELDHRVVAAVLRAAEQLRTPATCGAFVAVCAVRDYPLALKPHCLVSSLVGRTIQEGAVVTLPLEQTGAFFSEGWRQVSGVVILDLHRAATLELAPVTNYACTVLLNPNATFPGEPEWFPHARVCILEGGRFRWVRGAPPTRNTLPDGTPLGP